MSNYQYDFFDRIQDDHTNNFVDLKDLDNQADLQDAHQLKQEEENSTNELLNRNADALYDQRKWLKCDYKGRIKRFYEPPRTLPDLVTLLRKRFQDLERELDTQQQFSNHDNPNHYLQITYLDSEGEENGIDETINLLDAHLRRKKTIQKVLKMIIKVADYLSDEKKIKIQQQYYQHSVHNNQIAPAAVAIGSSEQQKQQSNQINLINNEGHLSGMQQPRAVSNLVKEEIKQESDLSDSLFKGLTAEEIQAQQKMIEEIERQRLKMQLQSKKDEEMARDLYIQEGMRVNSSAAEFKNEQGQNDYMKKSQSIKDSLYNSGAGLSQSQYRAPNIFKKLDLKVTAQFKIIDQVKAKVHNPKKGALKKYFPNFSFFQSRLPVPENKKLQAVIMTDQECYVKAQPGQLITLYWEVQNQSNNKWATKNNYINNYCADDAHCKAILIPQEFRLKPKQVMSIRLMVTIPQNVHGKDKVILQYRFEDGSKRECFGDSLIAILDLNPQYHNPDESVYDQFGSFAGAQLGQNEDEMIYVKASQLSDQGYGTFDRCLQILKACKGDLKEAERVLSKLMIKENKE